MREQELTDFAWKETVIFLFIIVLIRFDIYCIIDFEAIKINPRKFIGMYSYYI